MVLWVVDVWWHKSAGEPRRWGNSAWLTGLAANSWQLTTSGVVAVPCCGLPILPLLWHQPRGHTLSTAGHPSKSLLTRGSPRLMAHDLTEIVSAPEQYSTMYEEERWRYETAYTKLCLKVCLLVMILCNFKVLDSVTDTQSCYLFKFIQWI